MNILFLDVETTGTDPTKHTVIEVALEFHQNGKRVSNWGKKFCPEGSYEIDIGALKVNNSMLGSFSSRGSEKLALEGFVDYLLGLPDESIILCGHNISFDIAFVEAWLRKFNILGLKKNIIDYRVLDTATIATFLQSVGILEIKRMSLKNLAEELQVELPDYKKATCQGLHNAVVDVRVTADVFYKMQELIKIMKTVAEEVQLQDEE